MSVCLSVLGLPGPAAGWLGLGVQPPPAAHAAAHLPGGGPLLHQQAQAGRVAGTLEKGGEVPSGMGPASPTELGNQMLGCSHPLGCCQALAKPQFPLQVNLSPYRELLNPYRGSKCLLITYCVPGNVLGSVHI